jgi:metallo-beta-lactamase class B
MKLLISITLLITPVFLRAQTVSDTLRISDKLCLIKTTANTYIHVTESYFEGYGNVLSNGLIYLNGSVAFLFDTPATEAQTVELVRFLTDSLQLEIAGIIPNHWHMDCVAGLNYLHQIGVPSYGNTLTANLCKANGYGAPQYVFTDSIQLTFGNVVIECFYPGPAHTLDNIVVWLPAEQLLFAGCMVKSIASNNLGNVADGNVETYGQTISKLMLRYAHKVNIVVPGHGSYGGYSMLEHTLQLAKQR